MKKIFLVLLLLFGSLFATTEKQVPTVVPVSWIKENFSNPNLVIVDLRKKDEYDKGPRCPCCGGLPRGAGA